MGNRTPNDARKNLIPFKKGYDPRRKGNGRKPKLPELEQLLNEVLGEEKNDISAAKAVLLSLLAKATKGDVRAAEVLLDRAYGKAMQRADLTSNGDSITGASVVVQVIDNLPPITEK